MTGSAHRSPSIVAVQDLVPLVVARWAAAHINLGIHRRPTAEDVAEGLTEFGSGTADFGERLLDVKGIVTVRVFALPCR